ncbi:MULTISPECIES: hypothetical protein [Calothrix]|uniref:Uncharacterized protein n=2 Tax=Calothrix TaxID=1186 RepID=A0ABR8AMG8_9CYAN|nr:MULTISPECIES: hypothetical protein [Calothrix]MBD2199837.1 hypothetical protein [Calothrix parietina FACHB-288]MBD2228650.1 hypothetical protein [Calothrix anomala FACHB-343]
MEEIEYPDWTIDRQCALQKLENIAKDYIHYFTYQARDYQPMVVIWSRDELLKGLDALHLLNCEIDQLIFERISQNYPHLSQCVHAAECLWYTNPEISIQESDVSLDWMMFSLFGLIDDEIRYCCLEILRAAKLNQPRTLLAELQGQQYRLITDWDNKQIKLMTAVPLNVLRNPFMRETTPQNQYAPTYLELVTRASCDSLPMNWDILVDWGALGLLEELEDLSTDPSLPGAEYLKYCLEQYYFLLKLRR